MPFETDAQGVYDLDFIRGEGAAGNDPSADSLLINRTNGLFVYNPSGAAGAAGDNGFWHPWHALCIANPCGNDDVLAASSNTLLVAGFSVELARSVNRGRTWTYHIDNLYAMPIYESALPALAGPAGERGLVATVSDLGHIQISRADGAPGSWTPTGRAPGYTHAFGEVPPSAALPTGRLLVGVDAGVAGSTDGGLTFAPTSLFGGRRAYSLAFLPVAGHPYGGVAFAGVNNAAISYEPSAEVHRSVDGGATWTLAHRFTAEETGLPPIAGPDGPIYPINRAVVTATPDGSVWASVHYSSGSVVPGVMMRSADLGATWSRADAGFTGYAGSSTGTYPPSTPEQPYGWRVRQFALARTGVLYAATDRGVWRTTQPVVAAETWPTPASSGLSLAVAPNPSRGAATVTLTAAEPVRARVVVTDVTGREVDAAEVWATPAGTAVSLDARGWAAGVYVARASVGQHVEAVTARFTVMR